MKLKILAIGDLANNNVKLKKFLKNHEMHIINFRWKTQSVIMDEKENVEFFNSNNILEQVKHIEEIKDDYDLCLAISPAGARVAYLADLNYLIYFVGHDIRTPPFKKNVKDPFSNDTPIMNFNFLERKFYKNVYDDAKACVTTGAESYENLLKYRKDAKRIDNYIIDSTIFNSQSKVEKTKKSKFTFLAPQRIGLFKGYDIILDAIEKCETEFEIWQIEWFDRRNFQEEQFEEEFFRRLPKQVKLIAPVKRDEMVKLYQSADAILGQMKVGNMGSVELEAAMMEKPVLCFYDIKMPYIIDGKEIVSPFLPNSRKSEDLARLMDKVVSSKKFREDLAKKEYDFAKILTNEEKAILEWEKIFEETFLKCKSINRNSSTISKKFRIYYFSIINRLYVKKIKNYLKKRN